jgi:hypothetical protein
MVLPSSPGVEVKELSVLAAAAVASGLGVLQLEKPPALLRPKVGGAEDVPSGKEGCWEVGSLAESEALAMAMRSWWSLKGEGPTVVAGGALPSVTGSGRALRTNISGSMPCFILKSGK